MWVPLGVLVAGVAAGAVYRNHVARQQRRAARAEKPVDAIPGDVREFIARFRAELEACHPEVEIRGMVESRFAVVLALRGQEIPLSLHPLFRRCTAYPEAFSEHVAQLLSELASEALERTSDHCFADVATSILPQIRTMEWVRARGAVFGDSALAHRPLTDDLVTCYVIDDPWCMTFICRAHLRRWGRTEEDLFHLATQNLHALARARVPLPATDDGDGVLLRTGDGFDAARVLLLDPRESEGLLVAMPERDLLWVGRKNDADLGQLMQLNVRQAACADHPLSTHLYRMRDGQLVDVTATADSES